MTLFPYDNMNDICYWAHIFYRWLTLTLQQMSPYLSRVIINMISIPVPRDVIGAYGEYEIATDEILFTWDDMEHWWDKLELVSCSAPDGSSDCQVVINSSLPSAAYMRQWIGSALVQIMTCRLSRAKPLSKPMPRFCQLDPLEQISVKC